MTYYAGIDGGQSSTDAVIADESGKVLGRGSAGPSDEIGQGPDSTRLRDALRDALADAVRHAGLPSDTEFAAIAAGISGYEGRVYGRAPELPAQRLTLVHDSENAHAGALGGDAGVVVIAGTGSIGFARNERGETSLVGGWGFLFGDEGSAFWLARKALSDAMRDKDANEGNPLADAALARFGQPSLRKLARAFYLQSISRAQLASFASVVVEAAERGDERAAHYLNSGAEALVTLAMRAMKHVGMRAPKVAFIGGMTKSATYSGEIAQHMKKLLPQAQHVPPRYDAATGALILAYREAGIPIPESIA